jgi:hypothetical protein
VQEEAEGEYRRKRAAIETELDEKTAKKREKRQKKKAVRIYKLHGAPALIVHCSVQICTCYTHCLVCDLSFLHDRSLCICCFIPNNNMILISRAPISCAEKEGEGREGRGGRMRLAGAVS